MSVLSIADVSVERSGLPIVRGATVAVARGAVTVLLGVNGAGKTTLLEGVSGAIPTTGGQITLEGVRIEKLRAWRRARAGLAHVEQNRTVFRDMSTEDNLRAACGPGVAVDEVLELFPELRKQISAPAGLLSGGEQQMLVVGRALLGRPKVLMIDEMSLGLAPIVVERLARAVRLLADSGVGVLLVEQFATLALGIADRAYVMARGEMVYAGDGKALLRDESLLRALYLGDTRV
ncbi:ABC transporter ATP-binding protein [Actinokineospora globicatena]|uniref:ABC transporter ATP-binding protein n=1 Tax=Actinokineospora globicatena TaxID=103729 RepID=UPI0020A4D081|nr:ABC transporter ATP-binding protein [Actinokineospora globicatena]MCP2306256.1 amino acid/amide ABC transporter ATP-binding protein 2, HAAT family (TC 3.A.1.4.-) [Actinokineospora globicatena]GLW81681.1 ABC transporter ATP-binding protein [Actinokineospora globicatena]GLW88476.1 ABC transporter ATP-binding protein [Actinokineospora globicatena]